MEMTRILTLVRLLIKNLALVVLVTLVSKVVKGWKFDSILHSKGLPGCLSNVRSSNIFWAQDDKSRLLIPRGGGSGHQSSNNDSQGLLTRKEQESNKIKLNDTNNSDYSDDPSNHNDIEILNETLVYNGWRTILQRTVQMRKTGKTILFDLVGVKTGNHAVLIVAWDTNTKTMTLIREYMPGSHRILWGLPAGLVEPTKHKDKNETLAAVQELEEEAQLTGGTWIRLTTPGKPVAMDKYSLTNVHAFLVLDPWQAEHPKPMDEEEDIEVIRGVSISQIMEWIVAGEMNMVSAWGCLLAIEKLRELGEYSQERGSR